MPDSQDVTRRDVGPKGKPQQSLARSGKTPSALTEAARDMVLVRHNLLLQLRFQQDRLAVYVRDYILAREQMVQCETVRSKLEQSRRRLAMLQEFDYDYWNDIRRLLSGVAVLGDNAATPEGEAGLEEAVRAFDQALADAQARVDAVIREGQQLVEAQASIHQSVEAMFKSAKHVAGHCEKKTDEALAQLRISIERIFERIDLTAETSAATSQTVEDAAGYTVDAESAPGKVQLRQEWRDKLAMERGRVQESGGVPWPEGGEKWVSFKLHISRVGEVEFDVRAIETPMGEPHAIGRLPYSSADLPAVLQLLELRRYEPRYFTAEQSEILERLGLVSEGRPVADLLPRIGRALYDALFTGGVAKALLMALNQARQQRTRVILQLRFDQQGVELARYPWELLHDEHRHLLSGGLVEMTRYIAYAESTTPLPAAPPWRLLLVAARPQGLAVLPDDAERSAVWSGLSALAGTGRLQLDMLDEPTYVGLMGRLQAKDYHIIHFDGHGVFGLRCPECGALHYAHAVACSSCGVSLVGNTPLGYLAFEGEREEADWVSTEEMENLLLNSQVRLVVLSSCQSSVVEGESVFGGLGPGLVRAGVPAVVAMQFSAPVEAAVDFAADFYRELGRGRSLPHAVAQGRRRLFRARTWFIPALYLRSSDDQGRLFVGE